MAISMAAAASVVVVSQLTQVSVSRVRGVGGLSVRGVVPGARIVCMAAPTGSSGPAIDTTGDKVVDSKEKALEICADDEQSEECATAWDDVESAEKERAQNKGKGDPLDEYCEENPDADECRVYKD